MIRSSLKLFDKSFLLVRLMSPSFMLLLSALLFSIQILPCSSSSSSSPIEGRHSFSLTTFDPSGKLGQVERAQIAASLGTPIIAIIVRRNEADKSGYDDDDDDNNDDADSIFFASPQVLPSPFMDDDGTSRFATVAPHIAVAHSGISADGRKLVAAAQRLAVEHAYTFDESIPIEVFLEELSLLFQEYTMKPAERPFGAILLVAYLPPPTPLSSSSSIGTKPKPQLFRIDPSGSVVSITGTFTTINSSKLPADLETKLEELAKSISSDSDRANNDSSSSLTSMDELIANGRSKISSLLEDAINHQRGNPIPKAEKKQKEQQQSPSPIPLPTFVVSASLTRKFGLEIERRRINIPTEQEI